MGQTRPHYPITSIFYMICVDYNCSHLLMVDKDDLTLSRNRPDEIRN